MDRLGVSFLVICSGGGDGDGMDDVSFYKELNEVPIR